MESKTNKLSTEQVGTILSSLNSIEELLKKGTFSGAIAPALTAAFEFLTSLKESIKNSNE